MESVEPARLVFGEVNFAGLGEIGPADIESAEDGIGSRADVKGAMIPIDQAFLTERTEDGTTQLPEQSLNRRIEGQKEIATRRPAPRNTILKGMEMKRGDI